MTLLPMNVQGYILQLPGAHAVLLAENMLFLYVRHLLFNTHDHTQQSGHGFHSLLKWDYSFHCPCVLRACTFGINGSYQLCLLQIFSPSLWLALRQAFPHYKDTVSLNSDSLFFILFDVLYVMCLFPPCGYFKIFLISLILSV